MRATKSETPRPAGVATTVRGRGEDWQPGGRSSVMEAPAGHGGGLAVTFDADPGPGRFSPVFQPTPAANTASLNAGDRGLYVGGRAINGAFKDALVAAGHRADTRGAVLGYDVLHLILSYFFLCWYCSLPIYSRTRSKLPCIVCLSMQSHP